MPRATRSTDDLLSENSRIVQPSFLEKHSNKRDLQKRLRKLLQVLQTDESIEPNSPDWPGLAATAALLREEYLEYKHDKEVRLLSLACTLEIVCIYAPELPYEDEALLLQVFQQLVRQLANLANTTQQSQSHYPIYIQMLKLLAKVRIGAVLVDCALNELDDNDDDNDDSPNENALEVLVDFVHTLLHSVRSEHSVSVLELVQESIAVCLEEYHSSSVRVPTPILEELLVAIAPGPKQMVTKLVTKTTDKKGRKQQVPKQVEEPNPTYRVAANLIRTQADRLPLAPFLTGLVNADPLLLETTNILHLPPPDNDSSSSVHVYTLIYQLLRIAPSILTTVLGTVATHLQSTHAATRTAATQLLGQVFSLQPALQERYASIYRSWWQRRSDALPAVRLCVVLCGARLLPASAEQLVPMLLHDPDKAVRLKALHEICDWMYSASSSSSSSSSSSPPAELLQAVSQRVRAKDPSERKDAATGLARIYGRRYLQPLMKEGDSNDDNNEDNGDDNSHWAKLLHQEDAVYSWIPSRIWEALGYYADSVDATMRSRLFQLVDDVWWSSSSPLSSRARAVGWMHVLRDGPWETALKSRAALQQAVSQYIDARAQCRKCRPGTEQALAADAAAMECLETISQHVPPPSSKHSLADVLAAFHGARDKHIFRILASLADPCHSVQARARALDEMPKRAPSIAAEWTTQLVRRCAMGSLNATVVQECVSLARDLLEEDIQAAKTVLACLQQITAIFPSLVASSAGTLVDLLNECRSLREPEAITAVTAILAATDVNWGELGVDADELSSQLMDLCTKDGTPEQSRHAVQMLARLLPDLTPLLNALTSPSRFKIKGGGSDDHEMNKTIRILSALTALAEGAPQLLLTARGKKAVTFALEVVLMGRGGTKKGEEEDEDNDEIMEDSFQTPSSRKSKRRPRSGSRSRTPKATHETPKAVKCLLEDDSLSLVCRRVCAAMEFLTAYIRSTILESVVQRRPHGLPGDCVQQVFELLIQVLHDKGLPPSNRDRKYCRARQDRAALRRCAAVSTFRLCDPRLGLEKKLTPTMWHAFGQSILDEEYAVRERVLEELVAFLTGKGVYGKEDSKLLPKAPSLRFVSLVALASDGDHGAEHDGANGNAANVGKLSVAVKSAAMDCVAQLRKTSDATYAQCRAAGEAAERKFETQFKMMIMPEYMVPYAIHLLTHRNESPFEDDTSDEEFDEDGEESAVQHDDASRQRVLRKRLKLVFEPLVHSLGDTADNISFLLRMVENIGKNFRPVDVSTFAASSLRLSVTSPSDAGGGTHNAYTTKRAKVLSEKLKVICGAAREVLLSFVKKDVNLTPYPGSVQLPRTLFKPVAAAAASRRAKKARSSTSSRGEAVAAQKTPPVPKSILTERRFDRRLSGDIGMESATKAASRVHFSPDVVQRSGTRRRGNFSRGTTPEDDADFGDVSPIAASKSPDTMAGDATLGTTPPSALRGATLRSTAPDDVTTSEDGSPASRTRSPSQSQSPIVLEQILTKRGSKDDDNEIQTTSETPQTQSPVNTQESQQKSKASSKASSQPTRRSRRRRVPSQIQISHEMVDLEPKKKSRRRGSAKDAVSRAGSENRPITRNRARK